MVCVPFSCTLYLNEGKSQSLFSLLAGEGTELNDRYHSLPHEEGKNRS